LEHYEALLGLYGREVGLRHARKHLAGYADRAAEAGFGLPAVERGELVTGTDTTRVAAILARIYDEPMRRAA
jgi:tRNA-dihydrouridine synthase B